MITTNYNPELDWDDVTIVHFHLEPCPVCKHRYAGSSLYGCPTEFIGDVVQCEECGAEFKIIGAAYPDITLEPLNA